MRKRRLWWFVVLFRVTLVGAILPNETFDVRRYYADRFLIEDEENGSSRSYYISAESKAKAAEQFALLAPNCSLTSDIQENTCNETSSFCDHRVDSTYKTYHYEQEKCNCFIETCDEETNSTELMVLYPDCYCGKREKHCDLSKEKCHWTPDSDHDDLKFEVFESSNKVLFDYMLQAGSEKANLKMNKVSMVSKFFRQSGFNCSLRFMHHFTHQSSTSRLVVRSILQSGEKKNLYEHWLKPASVFWVPVQVAIGSYAEPFKISIDCETGFPPKKKKNKPFTCSIADIYFENCGEIRDPIEQCSRGDQFLCSISANTRCLQNAQCDSRIDCDDESDEMDCGNINGTMCDFNGQDYCNSWYQVTNVTDYHERLSEPTTVAPLNKLNEVPLHLFRLQSPSAKIKEAMRGSGNMLVFDHKPNPLTRRTSALVSPELPRTNPEAYDEKSPLFKSCKLRFYLCSRTYSKVWQISVISKGINPMESGRTIIYEAGYTLIPKENCTWERVFVNIPRQNAGFRIGIFVTNYFPGSEEYVAIDNLSFSPTCFERDINQSTWDIPDLFINTCGASGFEQPQNCDHNRELDGQTGHFLKEDGTQQWTVPVTGFYRMEICGAGGGSNSKASGDTGDCVTLQVHLIENLSLRMLIGQMGESPCFTEHDDELRPSSCSKISHNYVYDGKRGAAGGGATLLTVEKDLWNVVAGGGAGASWDGFDMEVGYGASAIHVKPDQRCNETCKAVSHTDFIVERRDNRCPGEKGESTVFGGFGGGGNSCGMLGGSGAGYQAGNPFGKSRARSGSSNVSIDFSKSPIYYQSERLDEGYIKIAFCRKRCEPPTVCRFRKDYFEEEYCGCPDGSNVTDTEEACAFPLVCPSSSTNQYRNFTYEPFCLCNNGKEIYDVYNDTCEEIQIWTLYNITFLIFAALTIIGALFVVYHYRNREKQMKQEILDLTQMKSPDYLYDDIYFGRTTRKAALDSLPSISRDSIERGRVLGRGNFGEVYYGEYSGVKLAVKMISRTFSASQASQSDFCNEALCMGTFVDENVVRLIGIDFEKVPYMIALEYMEGGDLLSFVKECRPNQVSLNPFQLAMSDLIKICCDVAAGCKCLETFGYVHRDIAARNILLTTRGPQRVAKIADFGMAKEITYGTEYYRINGRTMMPIKWTPPEAFIDGVFTTKSDIWSFGVLCWEVFSLGVVPYPNRRNEEVMLMLTEGARLEYPYGIPTRVYQLMRDCWKTAAADRPKFVDVVEIFQDIQDDPASVGMPFPIHPAVRATFAHSQSTPVSVETPMTAMTEISLNSTFTDASTVKVSAQQDMQDRIQLHELMLTREHPYTSELTSYVVNSIRKDLARVQYENGLTSVPQPEYLSPENNDESVQLIPQSNTVTDQTPPTSLIDLNRLGVQNTGPTLHRPDSLNFNDPYSSVPLLECQTR
ncbi:ALK tyrosine kinase receptor homolog scd-2 [Caenorhabditis elegans]|uniref:ALK tyrosine kinase receptor homolog scd-2 n=2 Tax=Caenorhabditis elegans TaxID=6239 RepID=SCD2_CAEEL|nr:ALK tyrosine kinase receptor homolog scd-2 [Caenorhabditis elegans]O76411.3 RecName: Full=ALK tyrosine kinase receptor homolog scd-2; AltName: Full=Suppressor of constitutive dauer formation protein 2; Flags: Precursor [Caenorhabditis elegans]CCD71218.1 ALK tyrosine kinase receptor homolog scd-2 [Caenorhabditis elegans]|eukprot:NP_504685.3 ALK tyrosine kinase receptor homolog scd-2 [Caenorhabditis elegans]